MIEIVHKWYHLLAPKLDPDVLTEVQHFLDHDEWEMAFEILLINLIDFGLPLTPAEINEIESIIEQSGINKNGGIYDFEIAEKFKAWKLT